MRERIIMNETGRFTAGIIVVSIMVLSGLFILSEGIIPFAGEAYAMGSCTARSAGMGEAYSAVASGCDASFWNPSLIPPREGVGNLRFALPSFSLGLTNSTLSTGFYNELNGAFWQDSEKESILDRIPDNGIKLDASVQVLLAAARISGDYATYVRAVGEGILSIPKDLADLALYGNEPGRSYEITEDNTGGRATAYSEAGIAGSWSTGWSFQEMEEITVGAAVAYVHGFFFADVPVADGSIYTDPNTYDIAGRGLFEMRSSLGGNGFTSRIGASTSWEGWQTSLWLDNPLCWIKWTKSNEHSSVSFSDTLTAESMDDDSLFEIVEESGDIDPFASRLPFETRLGISKIFEKWLVACDLGYKEGYGLKLATGFEYRPGPDWLLLRAGTGLGGVQLLTFALGAGLQFGSFSVDLSGANHHGIMGGSRGLELAFSLGIVDSPD